MNQQSDTIYVAIDIETTGPKFKNDILAIGVVIGRKSNQSVIEQRVWCFHHQGLLESENQDSFFEISTWNEFWSKNKHVLEKINLESQSKPESPDETWEYFKSYWDQLDERFPNDQIVILSDNPSFDCSKIDYQFFKRFDRWPMRYSKDNKYRLIQDPSERLASFSYRKTIYDNMKQFFKNSTPHWPTNDAFAILLTQFSIDITQVASIDDVNDLNRQSNISNIEKINKLWSELQQL